MDVGRRRGRPRLRDVEALRSSVCVKFPIPIHDALLRLVRRRGLTLPEFIRDLAFSELQKTDPAHLPLP